MAGDRGGMSPKSSPRKTLLQLQTRIYRTLREEAKRALGRTPAAILKYEAEYQRDFKIPVRGLRSLDRADLVQEIRSRDVSFVADYHTFAQAQRTALRLIRDAARADDSKRPQQRWLIGLEMIFTRQQETLDRFQAGVLTVNEFHRLVRYGDSWGFPWSHYEPIFDWARENGVRLIGLNQTEGAEESPTGTAPQRSTDLHDRDRWAASVITELFARSPRGQRPRMIVLFGELHVGARHLPHALEQASLARLGTALSSLSIHQNNDSLYWKLAREGREHRAQILKLKRDSYCVFSSTPWAKLESLLNWTDAGPEPEDPGDDAATGGESSSSESNLSSMHSYCGAICEFFKVEPPDFGALTAHAIQDADFVESLEGFDRTELALIRALIAANERFYLPGARIAYLAVPSMNHLAEAGALHLLMTRTGGSRFASRDREDFFKRILEAAFGFLGSLVLNPRRKCDLLDDHLRKLEELRTTQGSTARIEAQARESVIRFHRAVKSGGRRIPFRGVRARSRIADWMAARYLGRILARKLYGAILFSGLDPHEVAETFLEPWLAAARRGCEERYFRLNRMAAPAAIGQSSSHLI